MQSLNQKKDLNSSYKAFRFNFLLIGFNVKSVFLHTITTRQIKYFI